MRRMLFIHGILAFSFVVCASLVYAADGTAGMKAIHFEPDTGKLLK